MISIFQKVEAISLTLKSVIQLTLSWRKTLSYRNQWFLYDNGLRHERVNHLFSIRK